MEEVKKQKGRKKKYNNLIKTNIYIEQETLERLNEIVDLTNELKETKDIMLSSIIREILNKRSSVLVNQLKIELEKKQKEKSNFEEKIHKEEVQVSSYVMDNTQEVLQEINSKDPQWNNNPFSEGGKVWAVWKNYYMMASLWEWKVS